MAALYRRNLQIQERTLALLSDFYQDRAVDVAVRLIVYPLRAYGVARLSN